MRKPYFALTAPGFRQDRFGGLSEPRLLRKTHPAQPYMLTIPERTRSMSKANEEFFAECHHCPADESGPPIAASAA